mmetsp:Transcript_50846/g.163451  ORF Transcript_50846/g.163451 Transcript_50846/m.163451 type:complete len:358 (-) Transcript_50846:1306-2379(-)
MHGRVPRRVDEARQGAPAAQGASDAVVERHPGPAQRAVRQLGLHGRPWLGGELQGLQRGRRARGPAADAHTLPRLHVPRWAGRRALPAAPGAAARRDRARLLPRRGRPSGAHLDRRGVRRLGAPLRRALGHRARDRPRHGAPRGAAEGRESGQARDAAAGRLARQQAGRRHLQPDQAWRHAAVALRAAQALPVRRRLRRGVGRAASAGAAAAARRARREPRALVHRAQHARIGQAVPAAGAGLVAPQGAVGVLPRHVPEQELGRRAALQLGGVAAPGGRDAVLHQRRVRGGARAAPPAPPQLAAASAVVAAAAAARRSRRRPRRRPCRRSRRCRRRRRRRGAGAARLDGRPAARTAL